MTTGRINQVAADTGPIDARGPRPGRLVTRLKREGSGGGGRAATGGCLSHIGEQSMFCFARRGSQLFGTTAPRRHAREGARSPARPGGGPQLHQYS